VTIVADRVRKAIAECRSLKADDGSELNLTVSAGLTELTEGDDSESVLDRATSGLRTAILGGRNRTHAREMPVQAARRS
jgi:PleD family two-component response regulator